MIEQTRGSRKPEITPTFEDCWNCQLSYTEYTETEALDLITTELTPLEFFNYSLLLDYATNKTREDSGYSRLGKTDYKGLLTGYL